jgi:carbonic anhydrase
MNDMSRPQVSSDFPARLQDGYKAFHYGTLRRERERYERLAASGQRPEIMVIACCDSRAAPEIIFDSAPGEIFVVRNVANIVPPYETGGGVHGTSAALEFAVQALKVRHIVVMGHGRCGGIQAFREQVDGVTAEPLSPGDFIGGWISLLRPALGDIRCEDASDAAMRQRALEEAGIRNSIANLASFPCVATLLDRRQIALHGAWFDISAGQLWTLDSASGEFLAAAL